MISNLMQRIAVAFLTLFVVATLATISQAQQPRGFVIDYLDSWPTTNQMRYVKVQITPVANAALRDVDFHIVAKSTSYGGTGVAASTVIRIRKGDTSASGELYIPALGSMHTIHAETDGNLSYDRRDFAYRNYQTDNYGGPPDTSTGAAPSFVLASSAVTSDDSVQFTVLSRTAPKNMATYNQLSVAKSFPSLDDLKTWYNSSNTGFNGSRKASAINGFSSPAVTAMSLESLPSKWFAYEGLGMLMITFDDLKLLSQKHPGKLLAIERWVAASGRLVVLDSGDKLVSADEALQLLGDSDSDIRENRKTSFLIRELDRAELQNAMNQALANAQNQTYNNYAYQQAQIAATLKQSLPKVDLKKDTFKNALETGNAGEMISVEFGLGQVVFVSDKASDWGNETKNIDHWSNLGVFLSATDRGVQNKRSVLAGNMARQFGFPEFDEPPRYVFEFSILIYLVAIGPVAFFVLKRRHKLNLMFVIVPVISTLVCSSILAYAIFAEGFDTRVNLFTFTSLDQRSGRQTTASIAHVYSGMTPSAYSFSGPDYGLTNFTDGGRIQRVSWSDGGEQISGGEIRARSNHQIYSRSSNEASSKLAFKINTDGTSATVRNGFEVPVSAVAFRSADCKGNEAWFCQMAGVDETVGATKMSIDDIADKLRTISIQKFNSPLDAGKSYSRRSSIYGLSDINQSEVVNELENAWRMNAIRIGRHLESNDGRGYLAITDGPVNFEVPIENAKLETEIHVVKGIR